MHVYRPAQALKETSDLLSEAREQEKTEPVVVLFKMLLELRIAGIGPAAFAVTREDLEQLADKHQKIDEHLVSVGGRVGQALNIVSKADERVADYLARKDVEAPSGSELWETSVNMTMPTGRI